MTTINPDYPKDIRDLWKEYHDAVEKYHRVRGSKEEEKERIDFIHDVLTGARAIDCFNAAVERLRLLDKLCYECNTIVRKVIYSNRKYIDKLERIQKSRVKCSRLREEISLLLLRVKLLSRFQENCNYGWDTLEKWIEGGEQ